MYLKNASNDVKELVLLIMFLTYGTEIKLIV